MFSLILITCLLASMMQAESARTLNTKLIRLDPCPCNASAAWASSGKSIVSMLQDPLAIIGIVSILLPFIILGIAIATGVVDVTAGSSYGKS